MTSLHSRLLAATALGLLASAGFGTVAPAAEPPRVVATVPPLHSLTAAVMQGAGTPELLISGAVSEHEYTMRPSDAQKLSGADLVLWVGPNLESVLAGPLEILTAADKRMTISDVSGLNLLPVRAGAAWEAHDHGHGAEHEHEHEHEHEAHEHEHEAHEREHADHDHAHEEGALDPHFWLDPQRAATAATAIAARLAEVDPERAQLYRDNAAALQTRLTALDAELKTQLQPVAGRPFIVLHDAYHYLEDRYGLTAVGAITLTPEAAPSAQRLSEVRQKLQDAKAVCIFAEPQGAQRLVDVVAEGSSAKPAVLDPLGADLEPGPALYGALLHKLADSLTDCLG